MSIEHKEIIEIASKHHIFDKFTPASEYDLCTMNIKRSKWKTLFIFLLQNTKKCQIQRQIAPMIGKLQVYRFILQVWRSGATYLTNNEIKDYLRPTEARVFAELGKTFDYESDS